MPNVYTGQVQGLSLIAGSTPAAFCREVLGGQLTVDLHNIRKIGIGAQVHARKGTNEIRLEWNCVGPSATSLAKWFPTTAGVTVADFPAASTNFLVDVDDGTNGQEWVLSGCQPDTVKVSCAEGLDSEVEYAFSIIATTATLASAGTEVPVYNSVRGHTVNDVTVSYGSAEYGTLSFDLNNSLGARLYNAMDGKGSGAHSIATGALITRQEPTLAVVTTDEFKIGTGTTTVLDEDDHADEDITLAFANGTSGENITIVCSNMIPENVNMPLEAEGLVGFGHTFGIGSSSAHPTLHSHIAVG